MTRKEALEYINNMYMYEDTKNALETLIPEFGKTGSDKVIDHEDKYKEALLEARAVLEPCLKYSKNKVRAALDSIDNELKSFESEDERIRKELIEYHKQQFENNRDQEVGLFHKAAIAYLEKQKEQKQEWSEWDELMMKAVIGILDERDHPKLCHWLKSLPMRCPKSSDNWKPSEEQMAALEAATVRYQSTGLESLYEDLKKLM